MSEKSSISSKIEPKTYVIGSFLIAIILGLWSMPSWIPYAISPIARIKGLSYTFSHADRTDLRYVSWHNIQGNYESYSIKIERFTVPVVPYILIHHLFYEKAPPIEISRAQIIGDKSYKRDASIDTEIGNTEDLTLYEFHKTFIEAFTLWEDWRPPIHVDYVKGKIDGNKWILQRMTWNASQFIIKRGFSDQIGVFSGSLNLINNNSLLIKGFFQELDSTLSLKTKSSSDQLFLRGALKVAKSPIFLRSVFNQTNNIPESVRINAEDFIFPHSHFKVPLDTEVRSNFYLIWAKDQYSFDFKATTYSLLDPELKLGRGIASMHGTRETVSLDQIDFDGPSLNLKLRQPFTLNFKNISEGRPGSIRCQIDFTEQDIIPLDGKFDGEVKLEANASSYIKASLQGEGKQLEALGLTIEDIPVHCECAWPIITFNVSPLKFKEGSHINCNGTFDFNNNFLEELSLDANFTKRFNDVFQIFPVTFDQLTINANAKGSWKNFPWGLKHTTSISAKRFKLEDIKPFDLTWSNVAQGKNFSDALLDVSFSEAQLHWSGAFSFSRKKRHITTKSNTFSLSTGEKLSLKEAFTCFIKSDARAPLWQRYLLQISPFEYTSTSNIQVRGHVNTDSDDGSLDLLLENISGRWLTSAIDTDEDISELILKSFKAKGIWAAKRPFIGELKYELQGNLKHLQNLSINFHTSLDKEKIKTLAELHLNNARIASIDSSLPITITPGSLEAWGDINEKAPISCVIQTEDTLAVEEALKAFFNIKTKTPSFTVALHGSFAEPNGTILASSKKLSYKQLKKNQKRRLALDDMECVLKITPEGPILDTFTFIIDAHPVEIKGHWIFQENDWASLIQKNEIPSLKTTKGSLSAQRIPIAACSLLLPKTIKPEGSFSIMADKEENKWPSLAIELRDAATLPISILGSLKRISTTINFDDRILSLKDTQASLGEKTIFIDGNVDLHNWQQPLCNLHIYGKGIPVTRAAGIIIRSDLDVSAKTKGDETSIEGSINLHSSAILMDFGSIKASTTSPERPPPFFSIPIEPFASWRLNVHITGDHFLKINTPIFNSVVSASMDLSGTLNKPVAIGNVRLHRGTISFPFALFKISDGVIRLEPQNPFTPQIDIKAKARLYGYDTRLSITGTARQPLIQFSSSPSLSTTQILAMVSAGVVPQGAQSQSASGRLGGLGVYLGSGLLAELGFTDHLGDKLEISIGEYVTRAGKNTINIDYRVNNKISVLGEYDRYDAFNLDIKRKVYPW